MKCTVLQPWETAQKQSRVTIVVSKHGAIALTAFLAALLWAGLIKLSLWSAGLTMATEWFLCVISAIFAVAWGTLGLIALSAGDSNGEE